MTVNELRRKLNELPLDMDNYQIIMQEDSQCNCYSQLEDIEINLIYIPKDKYTGEVYDKDWTAETASIHEKKWQEMKDDKDLQCVLFFPFK